MFSRDSLQSLVCDGGIAIELGVAGGLFSETILRLGVHIEHLYSIDMWAGDRRHGDEEYREACKRLQSFGDRSVVFRIDFAGAVSLFPDRFFDFIYIDGYAHTGQEGGQTLYQWWSKLKRGGIFAGHDYSNRFPLTVEVVNEFARGLKEKEMLQVTEEKEVGIIYRSWYIKKLS